MRRFLLLLAALLMASLWLSACSRSDDSPLQPSIQADADKKGGDPIIVGDPVLLALRGSLDELVESDWMLIEFNFDAQRGEVVGYFNEPSTMPGIPVTFKNNYVPGPEISFVVSVPMHDANRPMEFPGGIIPFRLREGLSPELLESMILHIPYAFFNDEEIMSNEFRTFRLGEDNDGLPIPVAETVYVDENYDPFSPNPVFIPTLEPSTMLPSDEGAALLVDPYGDG